MLELGDSIESRRKDNPLDRSHQQIMIAHLAAAMEEPFGGNSLIKNTVLYGATICRIPVLAKIDYSCVPIC